MVYVKSNPSESKTPGKIVVGWFNFTENEASSSVVVSLLTNILFDDWSIEKTDHCMGLL